MPYFQSVLGNRLECALTCNEYPQGIQSIGTAAIYVIYSISLEYDMVIQTDLPHMMPSPFYRPRGLRHRKITKNKNDTLKRQPQCPSP